MSKAKNPDSLESWKITRAVLILAPLTSKIYLVVSGLYIITVSTLSCFHSQLVNGPCTAVASNATVVVQCRLLQLYLYTYSVRWSYDYSANSSQLTLSSLASLEIMCPKIRHKQSSLFCWPALVTLHAHCSCCCCYMLHSSDYIASASYIPYKTQGICSTGMNVMPPASSILKTRAGRSD